MTVAGFQGGARVHSDVLRVTFFTEIRDFFRGIGSSELTRFPEGLVLGNWEKTFHPRNVGFAVFVNKLTN
jgi:hypothetical protein